MTTFIEIHVVQSIPPSSLNRDGDGMPKSGTFGMKPRSRVSSQCWKRAMRQWYQENGGITPEHTAGRSRGWYENLRSRIKQQKPDLELKVAGDLAEMALQVFGVKVEPNDNNEMLTNTLLFLGNAEVEAIATLLTQNWATIEPAIFSEKPALPKEIVRAIEKTVSENAKPGEVAIFGRMMASLPTANVDSAVQVAHAIGTHLCLQEFDYFTSVDDLAKTNDSGADHIGDKGFNSATYYRFANLSVDQLVQNVGRRDECQQMIHTFFESFVKAMPKGSQNSFFANTPPALVLMNVRTDQPISLAGAFEKPAYPREGRSLLEESVYKLSLHRDELVGMYGDRFVSFIGMSVFPSLLPYTGNLAERQVDGGVDALLSLAVSHAMEGA